MERPKWNKGSSLWTSPTYLVEKYIDILEKKVIEHEKVFAIVKSTVSQPIWFDGFNLTDGDDVLSEVQHYINMLETRIVEMEREMVESEKANKYGVLWATRGGEYY